MMARVRTATSLIAFGFTVYKFFQIEIGKTDPIDSIIGPREFALTMISIGLASLLIPEEPPSLAAALAGLVAILGTLALIAVIFRHWLEAEELRHGAGVTSPHVSSLEPQS
ncbi:MAG TPA: hypothetical protein VHP35_16600 [Terriglobia bacterium]|nr:hypothetical protein [Terriglobia bacterium]